MRRYPTAIAVSVVMLALLSGCASPGPSPPGTLTPTPTPTTATGPATADLPPGQPRWPVSEPDAIAALQAQVDDGRQPWLLDPVEVAQAFARAEYGWQSTAVDKITGQKVTVRNPDNGDSALVVLAQPGKTGPTGIWLVVDVQTD